MTHKSAVDAVPAPDFEHRDAVGRLVCVTWKSPLATTSGSASHWLVAVDGSACSLRALDAAIRLVAHGKGGEIDLVHVQSWLSKEAAETELARLGWTATAGARARLDAAALPWHLYVVMGEAAAEIVALADELGSISIALGSRGLTAAQSVLLGSVACKVLHASKVPVLVVR